MRMNGRTVLAVTGAFVLVLAVSAAGWGALLGASPRAANGAPPPASTSSTGAREFLGALTPTPTPTPKPTAATPKPTPSRKPPRASLPPPPNPPSVVTPGPNCPSYVGTNADRSVVKAALTSAATKPYWVDVPAWDMPEGYDGDPSTIVVPVALMKAVAWQESGWQSAIKACDGGLGVMQITPSPPGVIGTDKQMNNRFHTGYDVTTLAGNAALGAEYLQWLTMYFGLYYFGHFNLAENAPTAPVGVNQAPMRLLDVVVAAYNVGPGAVEDISQDTLSIPNPRYVDNVTTLMHTCICLSY
ncbi:MAG: transglycosylase SLT domain-containing protein [Micromonosporaceae bacterium]